MKNRSILIVEDEAEIRRLLCEDLSDCGYAVQVAENGQAALTLFEQKPFDLVVLDLRLPDLNGLRILESVKSKSLQIPVIIMTGFGTVENAVEAMKKGAFDYVLKPFSLKNMEKLVEMAIQSCSPDHSDKPPPSADLSLPILTQDRRMKELLNLAQRIALSKATVLLQGESGTGKELFARFIHSQSHRNQGPFVAVNCASLPETLLESELFGHEKGAFTGAISRKIGKFELAHRGTILLDEVTEMNTFLQAKILRVLQEQEVDRIGGGNPIPIDIRVIATTNRDLESSMAKGEFREDLYYRLKVIDIKLPPLRERTDDIALLADHFFKEFSQIYAQTGQAISMEAMSWLKKQQWRGNVRELRNTLERAVLLCPRRTLEIQDLAPENIEEEEKTEGLLVHSTSLKDMEQTAIFKALERTQGNRTHAAKILGISIRTLRNKLHEYKMGVQPEESF